MYHRNDSSITRRQFTQQVAATTAALAAVDAKAAEEPAAPGAIRGEPTAEKVGQQILAAGGNAVDAIVAAALTAAVVVPHQTGVGGYGGHATLAIDGGRTITSIDFNTAAPAAAKGNMFPKGADGKVIGQKNMVGWLAAGVPGILAGLQLALNRYGTKTFRDVVQSAIVLAREGFPFGGAAASVAGPGIEQLAADPGSKALYFRDGKFLKAGDHYSNPDLARMLESLAKDNSVDSFYRGEIAEQIASAFAKNGGLVTKLDMEAYQARLVEPMQVKWGDWTIHTAPLTAGGPTIIELLMLLKELKWAECDPAAADTLQTQVEAMRFAWQDRLEFFGDPQRGYIRLDQILEPSAIRSAADHIEKAVAAKKPLAVRVSTRPDQGTIHLSAADRQGNLAALTLTHGGSFGAKVTVPGLGITLGHGMSRFDPHLGHPNAPGPHLRPLHNMCPTIVAKGGKPMFALGARGGRKIPNAVAEVLLQLVARGKSLTDSVAAPRLHTEGTLTVNPERTWPAEQLAALKDRGYTVTPMASATISAVGLTNEAGRFITAMR